MRRNLSHNHVGVGDQKRAIQALEKTLAEINFPRYSERVVKEVADQAEIHDRIRARSLAAAPSYVLH